MNVPCNCAILALKEIVHPHSLICQFYRLIDETADLNLELKEKLQDDDLSDEVVLNEWKNLSATFHHIALEHKETKSKLFKKFVFGIL